MNKLFLLVMVPFYVGAAEVAITIDDLHTDPTPLLSPVERSQNILQVLRNEKLSATLFVCGKRVDSVAGKRLLKLWDLEEHQIGNHTYSHHYYHSSKLSFEDYRDDFLRGENVIKGLNNFTKTFRYPYLKHGNTTAKRDKLHQFLDVNKYSHGYVTIDASDWYIDKRLRNRLAVNPKENLIPYRDYYLDHMWDRAQYYDALAKKVLKRDVKHTLLIHDNLLNALFLGDLIEMFKLKGWKLIDSAEAFNDPIFTRRPNILPAGESIVWALAKESGVADLRYPAEDGKYQEKEMDKLGL